jgi:peptidylprolyl isomerase/FKBP-type peptidyl-prolyl cis-trans isomerase FklB
LGVATAAAVLLLGGCQVHDEAAANLKAAEGFLRLNAQQPGVIALPSGLEYRIVRSGPADGAHPGPGAEVRVNYEGKLLDGKVFDSSFQRGEPLDLPLDRVIPGWTEALERMRPGDEWILYIPPQLGYRDKEAGPIPPNSLLIFRVQLLSILPHQPELG